MKRAELPLDVKLMRLATNALLGLFVVGVLGSLGWWAARHPAWSVAAISVHGDVAHQNAVTFRAHLALQKQSGLAGNFLTIELQQVKRVFESVPWVREAVVQREFPNRLRVTIEEHQAEAWWGEAGSGQLVSRLGEVFEASPDDSDSIPVLAGPVEHAGEVLSLYHQLAAEFGRLDLGLERLELTDRGNWRAELDNGGRLELGRGSHADLLARTQRFTSTIAQVTQRYAGAMQTVDLRYPNGYALQLRGVTTVDEQRPGTTENTR